MILGIPRRSLGVARLAVAAACTSCTPFKEDTPFEVPVEAGQRCDFNAPFGTPRLVPGLDDDELMATSAQGLRLSPDSLGAFFNASDVPNSPGQYEALYMASRNAPDLPFGMVAPIAGGEIATSGAAENPTITGDGLTLFYDWSTPPQSPASIYTIYYATRPLPSVPFEKAAPLLAADDGGTVQGVAPFVREDGEVLYFATTQGDIYSASLHGSTLGAPVVVTGIDGSSRTNAYPIVTPDDLTIYFASARTDGASEGDYDIWAMTRTSPTGPFSGNVDVAEVNTDHAEFPSFITSDGCTLYLASNRGGTFSLYLATKAPR